MYLIIKAGTGEVITNTTNPDEAQFYDGAVAVSYADLGIGSVDDLPAHPSRCLYDFQAGTFSVDQAKVDAQEAEAAAEAARNARVEELYAATNPADDGLTEAERMFRIGRLQMGLSETI